MNFRDAAEELARMGIVSLSADFPELAVTIERRLESAYAEGLREGMERAANHVEDAAQCYDTLLQSPYSLATKNPHDDEVRMDVLYQMEEEIRALKEKAE